ncbi:MAG: alpha-amylase [Verrucomicrobia bacterium]|nr:alpha-amylase [Verrucomicrobiota bacterium]
MKPVIYQLVVRYFGNTTTVNQTDGTIATNGCGKFADINDTALQALKAFGATHIWLAGCLRQATLTGYPEIGLPPDDPDVVKGRAGSLYAVRDYFDVSPDYARNAASRLDEFAALVGRIHGTGLKVMLDFVSNHVARGYHSVVKPDFDFGIGDDMNRFFAHDNHFFYLVQPPGQRLRLSRPAYWNPAGVNFDGAFAPEDGSPGHPPRATGNNVTSSSPAAGDWYETIKLNYGYNFVDQTGHYDPRPRTWDAVDQILAYWQEKGVDGFRCDFAHYVPAEAWSYLITRARQRDAGAFFLAEAYPYAGSGDPVTNLQQLVDAGFDAVYHYPAYNLLKQIYQGHASPDDYDHEMAFPPVAREHLVHYLENHDERRVASPIVRDSGPGGSGFGSAEAGYQLAPLQFLSGRGPVLLLNGQETGEPGAGAEGFNLDDGRTTFFDYWAMPEFVKWVNDGRYDGGALSAAQSALRNFYAGLLGLCQDPSVNGDGYWGLKYFNRPERFPDCPNDLYSFARFQNGSGRLLVVVANFCGGATVPGRIRIPPELATAAALTGNLKVQQLFGREGVSDLIVSRLGAGQLASDGFPVSIATQSACVYAVTGA